MSSSCDPSSSSSYRSLNQLRRRYRSRSPFSGFRPNMKYGYYSIMLCGMKPCYNLKEEDLKDKSSDVYQRVAWDDLRKAIYVLVNKVNAVNIGTVRKQLLQLNILRGKGLFCQYITEAQTASTKETHVYASLVATINCLLPDVGEIVVTRCIMQFHHAFNRNHKSQCLAPVIFIAHLINHGVTDEILGMELLRKLFENLNLFKIQIAIVIFEICGKKMYEIYGLEIDYIVDKLHCISLIEELDKKLKNRIQFILELHSNKFKVKLIDLVPAVDCQTTHYLPLDTNTNLINISDYYFYDSEFESTEKEYKLLTMETEESENEDD